MPTYTQIKKYFDYKNNETDKTLDINGKEPYAVINGKGTITNISNIGNGYYTITLHSALTFEAHETQVVELFDSPQHLTINTIEENIDNDTFYVTTVEIPSVSFILVSEWRKNDISLYFQCRLINEINDIDIIVLFNKGNIQENEKEIKEYFSNQSNVINLFN